MTGRGTNTYIYRSPAGSGGGGASLDGAADSESGCVVIDPGVDDAAHLDAIRAAAEERGGIDCVVITHHHPDHDGGADKLGAPVIRPADGERHGGLRALATPGHAIDHVCLVVEASEHGTAGPVVFSGDLILGEGSTIVPPDGGSLIAYLDSLRRVGELGASLMCPGHGPWVTDPAAKVAEYREHRLSRERGLIAALERGERSRGAILDEVWSDAPEELRFAAALVLQAHLEKLEIEGYTLPDLTE